jgi:hypothetical protein
MPPCLTFYGQSQPLHVDCLVLIRFLTILVMLVLAPLFAAAFVAVQIVPVLTYFQDSEHL